MPLDPNLTAAATISMLASQDALSVEETNALADAIIERKKELQLLAAEPPAKSVLPAETALYAKLAAIREKDGGPDLVDLDDLHAKVAAVRTARFAAR